MPGLRKRIAALEHDLAQAKRDAHLVPHWNRELAGAEHQLRHIDHSIPLPRGGVDYSFARPSPTGLRRIGATFAGRYLTGGGKALTVEEARDLGAAGLDLVALFELEEESMALGGGEGAAHGRQALDAARALGMPLDRPIYFACDFDIDESQMGAALDYMYAARRVLAGHYYAAAYGGLRLVTATLAAGFGFAWQTLAWSGGTWNERAQLRQIQIGSAWDTDRALAADFGQWRL
jgi:Domain of unknown function (DUF1906)